MRISEITSELKEKDKIAKLLNRYFVIDGDDYIIDGGMVYTANNCIVNPKKRIIFDELPIKFGRIGGDFSITDTRLKTLKGCPEVIGQNFRCYNNQLTNLEGSPKKVGGIMIVAINHLTSLEGAPDEVGGAFVCRHNNLTNLIGAPSKVGGFQCDNNQLTSLEGLPKEINGPLNLDYSSTLPLLRIILSSGISSIKFSGLYSKLELAEILMKYVGKGRAGAMQCAAEMTKAGYKDNARL